jgi:LysR family transcriptional regulator, nitrogen assimilation regulatory protein
VELRSLRYFVKIVECGSLSRAADALFVAQPSLSHQLAMLEEELGVRLVDRSAKGVKATPAGMVLYRCAVSIGQQIEDVRSDIHSERGNISGNVSLGLPTSTAVVLALPLLHAVVERYPNICLEINENGSGLIGEWLLHGRLDLAMLFTQGPIKALRCQHILTEDICFISNKTEADPADVPGRASVVRVATLQNERLVLPSRSNGLRQIIDEAFALQGVRPKLVAELSMLHTLREAVLSGVASTMLPMSAVIREAREGRLAVTRVDPPILRPLSLCVNAGIPLSAAGEAVYATVVEITTSLVSSGAWPGVSRLASQTN